MFTGLAGSSTERIMKFIQCQNMRICFSLNRTNRHRYSHRDRKFTLNLSTNGEPGNSGTLLCLWQVKMKMKWHHLMGLEYRQVPRLSRVPVLAKITLNSLAIQTGNLAGKSRGTRVHVPRYTTLRYQSQTARQPKSSL